MRQSALEFQHVDILFTRVQGRKGRRALRLALAGWTVFVTNIPAEQLTVFPQGGHLGNLFNPDVQKSILAALTPMRPPLN